MERTNLDIYGAPPIPWSRALKQLEAITETTHPDESGAAQGWPVSVSGGAFTPEFSAPSAGPPPWDLYVVTPVTAFGVATAEPYGATRWRFHA